MSSNLNLSGKWQLRARLVKAAEADAPDIESDVCCCACDSNGKLLAARRVSGTKNYLRGYYLVIYLYPIISFCSVGQVESIVCTIST